MRQRQFIQDLEEARAFVRQYRLDLHDPSLACDLDTIDSERPRPTVTRHFTSILERLQQYEIFHQDHPFVVALASLFTGELVLAYQVANGVPIRISLLDLARHLGIYGGTGVGKSTFVYHLLEQLRHLGIKIFILDPKDDSFHIAVNDSDFLVISPTAMLNPLQRPSFLIQNDFINLFTSAWGETWYSGENQKQVLDEGLIKAFSEHATPCLADVKQVIDKMHSPKLTFSRRDAITGVANRLARFGRAFPGPYQTRNGITWDELFKHSLYINTLANDEYTTFIYCLLVNLLYLHNRRKGIRNTLDYVLVNDEGNQFWNAKQSNISGVPTLVNLQGTIREFGIGLIHTSVDQASLHPILKSNTNTTVAMSVTTGKEEREVVHNQQLNREQTEHFRTRLETGQCIISLGTSWKEPLLCSFPYRKQEKQITADQRREAEERINSYAPEPQETRLDDQNPHEQAQKPTKKSRREEPQKPPSRAPDAASEEPRHVPIKLTIAAERLLRTTARRLYIATEAYLESGLSRQAGQNAKTMLVKLCLLIATSILVRPGRGGNAVVLEPTPAGCELIGRERAVGTKGGDGAQHRWCIQELAKVIPGAQVEVMVADKSVDLLVPFDPERHGRLLYHMDNSELPTGALVAVEVEISAPARTGLNNITKNHDVGVFHTIVAVLPRHVETTRKSLAQRVPRELRSSYTVVDYFALLTGCKQ